VLGRRPESGPVARTSAKGDSTPLGRDRVRDPGPAGRGGRGTVGTAGGASSSISESSVRLDAPIVEMDGRRRVAGYASRKG